MAVFRTSAKFKTPPIFSAVIYAVYVSVHHLQVYVVVVMALLKYLQREGPVLKCDTLKKETKPVTSALNGLLMTSIQRLATSIVRLNKAIY